MSLTHTLQGELILSNTFNTFEYGKKSYSH